MSFLQIGRGGDYLRVADPGWEDPLDGDYAKQRGGRWNLPGSFGVVYLCATIRVARAFVLRKLQDQPYGPEDVDEKEAPDLLTATITLNQFVDVVTDSSCIAAGLPPTYPRRDGQEVSREECQSIGARAWQAGENGIACRSASPGMTPTDEELAWFEKGEKLHPSALQRFNDWFWPA